MCRDEDRSGEVDDMMGHIQIICSCLARIPCLHCFVLLLVSIIHSYIATFGTKLMLDSLSPSCMDLPVCLFDIKEYWSIRLQFL